MKLYFITLIFLLFHIDVGIGRTIENDASIELSPREGNTNDEWSSSFKDSEGRAICEEKDLKKTRNCEFWKSKGYCTKRFASFMKKNCCKTCNKCNCSGK